MVMATQNPIESYGTFPLPEAQMDRFFMRLSMGYPVREDEIAVLQRRDSKAILSELDAVVTPADLTALQAEYPNVRVSDEIAGYLMDLVERIRAHELVSLGVSTRGALALYRASQIRAAVKGRDYVIPEDVKAEAVYVLPHRLSMASRASLTAEAFVNTMLETVPVPLEAL
jgi:MoxR-like ATPase